MVAKWASPDPLPCLLRGCRARRIPGVAVTAKIKHFYWEPRHRHPTTRISSICLLPQTDATTILTEAALPNKFSTGSFMPRKE